MTVIIPDLVQMLVVEVVVVENLGQEGLSESFLDSRTLLGQWLAWLRVITEHHI
jgi:hypothetical protein|nr:hypothetical protein Q903MT_gene2077 [Picea sitchensis]